MIRKGYTQDEICKLLYENSCSIDTLPFGIKQKIIAFFQKENTYDEWKKNRGLLEYIFNVNIVFVEDVHVYNSKLISLNIQSKDREKYVYLKIYPNVIEAYQKNNSIFIPNLF
jgi:hypothetical protein